MRIDINPNIDKNLLLELLDDALNGKPPSLRGILNEYEARLFPITIEDDDIFYHGTSQLLGDIIMEYGLYSLRATRVEQSYGTDYLYPDFIFVTKDINMAESFAKNRAKIDESTPIIFTIKGKDINNAKCKAFIDPLIIDTPVSSIVLTNCVSNRVKIRDTIKSNK